MFALLLLLGHL